MELLFTILFDAEILLRIGGSANWSQFRRYNHILFFYHMNELPAIVTDCYKTSIF